MKYVPYLLLMFVVAYALPVWAQDLQLQVVPGGAAAVQTVAPQAAPPLPDTKTGWLDFIIKKLPGVLGVVLPIGMVIMKAKGQTWLAKVPTEWAPIVSAVLTTVASLATAEGSQAALDGGGIAPGPAALTGGGTALITHSMLNQALNAHTEPQQKKG